MPFPSLLETKPEPQPARTAARPRRILAVWTRALDGVDGAGRVNVARSVRDALAPLGQVAEARLQNALERRGLAAAASTAWALLRGLLSGRPVPLQCAIFAHPRGVADAVAAAAGSDAIYLDGVRTLPLLRRLRRAHPDARIVVDADDLMSRRYAELIGQKLPLSLGYLEARVPGAVARAAKSRAAARLVLGYERMALRHAERELLALADRVVLLNREEAAMLSAEADRLGARRRATVVAIPPVVKPAAPRRSSWSSPGAPLRAVFIGTDGLTQNRLTIDFLLDLWRRERPPMPLVIYGRQSRPNRDVPNVAWAGYVKDIADVYAPGSILVTPSFLRGGIKTKVLEGFAHGVPVVGNSVTFEGLDLPGYPLCFDDRAALVDFLKAPSAHSGPIARALKMEDECLQRDHAAQVFAGRWADAVFGARSTGPSARGALPRGGARRDDAADAPRRRARPAMGLNDNGAAAGFASAAGE